MEIKQRTSGPNEGALEQLRKDPDVIHHQRDEPIQSWTFKPWIRVKPGTDLSKILERIPRRSDERG